MVKHSVMILAALGMCLSVQAQGGGIAESVFGKTEGTPVETGAVFVDGVLLNAPYTVTQVGNTILINGEVVNRFEVLSAAEKRAKASGTDKDVAEEAPELPEVSAKKPATRRVLSVEERKAAEKKRKEIEAKFDEKGSFNIDPVNRNPNALFEEADYTYTPPKREEPKVVPYVRPVAVSGSERIAQQRARAEEMKAEREERTNPFREVEESFDSLSEKEIEQYKAQFVKRRAVLENALQGDGMIVCASMNSATAVLTKPEMQKFLVGFFNAMGKDNQKMMPSNPKIHKAYVAKMWENRATSKPALVTILKRLKEAAKKD